MARRRKRLTFWSAWRLAQSQMNPVHIEDVEGYAKYFSEASFQKKLRMVGKTLGENVLLPVLRAYYVLRSPAVSMREKALLLGALGYFVLPLDFIPDFLPGLLGFTDDLVVVTFILKHVKDSVTPEINRQAMIAYRRITAPCAKRDASPV